MTTHSWPRWRVTEFLKPDEVDALLLAVRLDGDRLLLRTLWETGGRPGEVARLLPEHIDTKNNCILLLNFKQRRHRITGSRQHPHPLKRVYLFPESTLCQDLLEYCRGQHIKPGEWVFPSRRSASKPFSAVTLWRLVTTLAEGLGIRYVKKDPRTGEYRNKPAWPHTFRHGSAVNMLERTSRIDVVRDQLGHASVSTTEIYAHLTDVSRKRIIEKSLRPEEEEST